MNRKSILVFIGIAFLVVTGASIIALNQNGGKPISTLPRAETVDNTLPVKQNIAPKKDATLKEYSDPSGFRFLYPANLNIVVENKESDPDSYSSLKLKPETGLGVITINVNATNFKKLDEWVKANKISLTSTAIKRIKLADIDAYELPIQNQLVTGAYDDGALFTIVLTDPKNEALLTYYHEIVSSFAFYQPVNSQTTDTTNAAPAPDHSSVVDTDSEEVIE